MDHQVANLEEAQPNIKYYLLLPCVMWIELRDGSPQAIKILLVSDLVITGFEAILVVELSAANFEKAFISSWK